jgi:hypothetical protein
MFKKILAVLAIVGMLMGVGFGKEGIAQAADEPIPTVHNVVWKVQDQDMQDLVDYVFENGSVNTILYVFTGILSVTAYFISADTFVTLEAYPDGTAFVTIEVPYDGKRTLSLVEDWFDDDLLVDAIGIVNADDQVESILYYLDSDNVPSVYSSEFRRILSKILHNEVYNSPINHAVIEIGE